MIVHTNTQVKDEAILLEHVLPFWQEYPIDEFVFFDDGSSDNTEDVIYDFLGDEEAITFKHDKVLDPSSIMASDYNEPKMRSKMLEYSRSKGADIVISIDADELLSQSFLSNFDWIMEQSLGLQILFYQYNVVGSLSRIRQDPAYINNYRNFVLPLNHTEPQDVTVNQQAMGAIHESKRTPVINLPTAPLKDCGFIHLQALNVKFYALKQLFYKVFEYKEYNRPIDQINETYDGVVNGLNFCEIDTPRNIVGDWKFDASVFDKILEERKYIDYIKEHGVDELITFGEEYLK